MKKIIALMALLSSINCFAQLDYKVFSLYRTFPSAFSVVGQIGYSIPFYKNSDVVFGYVRPSLELQTSGVVNTAIAKLDFNPISFVNLYVGTAHSNRNYEKFDDIDCETYVCTSKINRTLYGARVALAYADFYYIAALKYYDTSLEGSFTANYVETLGTLLHSSKNSMYTETQHVLGYTVNDKLEFGYLGFFNKVKSSDMTSQMHLLFGRKKFWEDKWEATVGAGIFKTSYEATRGTIMGILTWAPEKGLPLF